MRMIDYIREIKRQFHDVYHFEPARVLGGRSYFDSVEYVFAEGTIPDGEYPMEIGGILDRVRVVGGKIHCCNFEKGGRS